MASSDLNRRTRGLNACNGGIPLGVRVAAVGALAKDGHAVDCDSDRWRSVIGADLFERNHVVVDVRTEVLVHHVLNHRVFALDRSVSARMDLELTEPALDTPESQNEVGTILPIAVIKAVPHLDIVTKPWAGLDKLIIDLLMVFIDPYLLREEWIALSVGALDEVFAT